MVFFLIFITPVGGNYLLNEFVITYKHVIMLLLTTIKEISMSIDKKNRHLREFSSLSLRKYEVERGIESLREEWKELANEEKKFRGMFLDKFKETWQNFFIKGFGGEFDSEDVSHFIDVRMFSNSMDIVVETDVPFGIRRSEMPEKTHYYLSESKIEKNNIGDALLIMVFSFDPHF